MKYSLTCPPDGVVMSTEAKNDEEAMTKLLEISRKHIKEYHLDKMAMSDAESRKFIRENWKKG